MKSLFWSVFFLAAVLLPCSAVSAAGQEPSAVADTVLRGSVVPMNGVFLRQLQERDSILVADQLYYGVNLEKVKEGTQFVFPEIDAGKNAESGLMILSDWYIDTLKVRKQKKGEPKLLDLQAGIVLTSFMEGDYVLNPVTVQRISEFGVVDTLVTRTCSKSACTEVYRYLYACGYGYFPGPRHKGTDQISFDACGSIAVCVRRADPCCDCHSHSMPHNDVEEEKL